MAELTAQQVDLIARRLMDRTGHSRDSQSSVLSPQSSPRPGIFSDLDSAVSAAAQAFRALDAMSLAARDRIIAGIRETMLANAESLAREAHAETGFGRWEDKL